jgi:hypothetical protein
MKCFPLSNLSKTNKKIGISTFLLLEPHPEASGWDPKDVRELLKGRPHPPPPTEFENGQQMVNF